MWADTLLMTAFPIQIAAFLMTCVRKSIMSATGWHYWYLLSLVLALFTTVDTLQELAETWAFGGLLYAVRAYFRLSKFVLWGCITAAVPFAAVTCSSCRKSRSGKLRTNATAFSPQPRVARLKTEP